MTNNQPIADNGVIHNLAYFEKYFSKWISDIEKFLEERDRRYDERFRTGEDKAAAAVRTQKELTDTAFAAAQQAIVKSEQAQKEYNARSNEFRQALDDAGKNNISRSEFDASFKATSEKMETYNNNMMERFNLLKDQFNEFKLEETKTTGRQTGRTDQSKADQALLFSTLSLLGTVIVVVLTVAKFLGF